MKIISIISLMSLFILTSCDNKPKKPYITLGKYSEQVTKMKAVMDKLQAETDIKVMNFMADGVETTRAIPCDAIGNECNAYYQYLNKVVSLTNDGELDVEERKILTSLYKKAYDEIAKSEKIIQTQWKNYINSQE